MRATRCNVLTTGSATAAMPAIASGKPESALDLTPTERAIYDAARAEAHADRWRIVGDLEERDGKPSAVSRHYQAEYEAEAADAWRRLEDLRAQWVPAAAE